MHSARLLLAVTVSVLVVAPSPTGAAPVAAAPARPVDAAAVGTPRTVTLVTGDQVRVTVNGERISVAGITPGKGRTRVSFLAMHDRGHLRVVPDDALPLLRAGRLDPRLFDVTTLVRYGYDDRRKDLPLIVTGGAETKSRLAGAGAVRTVPGGGAVRAAKPDLPDLWRVLATGLGARSAGPSKLWLDGLRQPSLDVSVPLIGAPAAWAAGYTGTGVTVSVVDTGIDGTHPDLAGRVAAAEDFTGVGNTLDQVGHGTHVAATIASNDSRYRGVAPDVRLLSAKVCADIGCAESAILAGMQWSAEQGAKVINMSLGGSDTPEQDPLEAAVEDLTARFGALFVIAAGNTGGTPVQSPGSADSALTVGAVTRTDELADFSSRGPRLGDHAIKPDVTAPGVDIVAARSKDGFLGDPGETHMPLSGTSMATPHVAGAAAILLQQHPTWTPAQLKATLMGSARPSGTIDVYAQGAGRVDVAHAVTTPVLASPPSLSFGLQLWPHTDDVPDARTVTYHNSGASAVTLALSLTGGAPAGLFSLSASSVTVPAGGSAPVTLTSDTRVNVADARYAGYLVAEAGTTRLSVPFAVQKEVESYTLTTHHLDRAGQPTDDFFTGMLDPATGNAVFPAVNGQATRVPRGNYAIISGIFGPDTAGTLLLEPEVAVDRDVTVTMDARHGRPVTVSVPLPGAAPVFVVAAADIESVIGNLTGIMFGPPDNTLYVGSADPSRRSAALHGLILAQYTKDGADPLESPYFAQVMWREQGRMFPGFTKRLRAGELAVIDAEHAADHPAGGFLQLRPVWPEGWAAPLSPGSQVAVPGNRTEFYNTDEGVEWIRTLFVSDAEDPSLTTVLVSLRTRFEGGRHYPEKRNVAVSGPGFGHLNSPEGWLSRRGDTFSLLPSLANDQANWYRPAQPTDTLRITLDRNGTRVFEGNDFATVDVPPGTANYRLSTELTRQGPGELSTSVSCVWTFRSGTVPGDTGVPLPLSVVRFLPRVDATNTAPAGRLFAVPVEVQRQEGSAAGSARTLDVEVSYDDGATWRRVPVARFGQGGLALLHHPAGPGFVSLRASSTDSAGRTVTETVIHAYRLG